MSVKQEEKTMRNIKRVARQYFKRSFSLPAANYKLATYQHDQCERSLRMHLFSLEKRDLTLVLTLFIAFGLLCIILAGIAPQVHVFDTILISKSVMDSQISERSSLEITKQVEKESIDMDLAPPRSFDQPLEQNSAETEENLKTKRRPQDKAGSEYETFLFTKPLNNLNKNIGLDLRAKFNIVSSSAEMLRNSSKTSVSFKIDFIFETLDSDGKLNASRFSILKSISREKANSRGSVNITSYPEQTNPPPTRAPTKNSGFRVFQQLNVTFDCEIREYSPPSRGEIDSIKTSINNNPARACDVPDFSVQFKISHSKRRIYKVTIKIADIKFKSSTKLANNDDNPGTPLNLKSLELITLLSHTNSSFVLLTIFIRLALLILSFSIACCFMICLSEYKFQIWSLEQKWTALLLILLVGSNRPLYMLEFTASTKTPPVNSEMRSSFGDQNSKLNFYEACSSFELVDSILDLTFICGLLVSWSCFAHSIRQMSRPFLTFYATKFYIVGFIWLFIAYANSIAFRSQQQVTFGNLKVTTKAHQSNESIIQAQLIDMAFYSSLFIYFANLTYHYTKSYIELKLMSYFTLRFRLQLILCLWVLATYSIIIFVIPAKNSPKLAHNFLQQTSDVLEEMDQNRTLENPVNILSSEVLNNDRFKIKSQSQVYDNSRLDGTDNDGLDDMLRLSSKDKSVVEMISLTRFGNMRDKTRFTSIFQPHSFFEHYQHKISNDKPRAPNSPFKPRLLNWIPANHLFDSACSFLCYVIVNNLYVLACAYFYWPVVKHDPQIACKYLPVTSRSEARQTNKEIDSPQ